MNIMLGCLYLPVHASYKWGFGICAQLDYASKGTSSMYAVVNHGGILMATLGDTHKVASNVDHLLIYKNLAKHTCFVYNYTVHNYIECVCHCL